MQTTAVLPRNQPTDAKSPATTNTSNTPNTPNTSRNPVTPLVYVPINDIYNTPGLDTIDKQLIWLYGYDHLSRLPSIIHIPEKYDMKKAEAIGKDHLPPREKQEDVKYFLFNNIRHFFSPYSYSPLATLTNESYDEYFARVNCQPLLSILNRNTWLWETLETILVDLESNKIRLNTPPKNDNTTQDTIEIREMMGFIARIFIEGNKLEELNRFYLANIHKQGDILHLGDPSAFFRYTITRENLKQTCLKWLQVKDSQAFFTDLFMHQGHFFNSASIDKKTTKLVVEKICHNMSAADRIAFIRSKKKSDAIQYKYDDISEYILTIMQEDLVILLKNLTTLTEFFPELFPDIDHISEFLTFKMPDEKLDDFKKNIYKPEVFLEKLITLEIALFTESLKTNNDQGIFLDELINFQMAINKLAACNKIVRMDNLFDVIRRNKESCDALQKRLIMYTEIYKRNPGDEPFTRCNKKKQEAMLATYRIILSKLNPSAEALHTQGFFAQHDTGDASPAIIAGANIQYCPNYFRR